MIETQLEVENRLGIHARPAALIVQTCAKYKSDITLSYDGIEVNARSIMSVMMLAAESGATILLAVAGEDEEQVVKDLRELFKARFNEE